MYILRRHFSGLSSAGSDRSWITVAVRVSSMISGPIAIRQNSRVTRRTNGASSGFDRISMIPNPEMYAPISLRRRWSRVSAPFTSNTFFRGGAFSAGRGSTVRDPSAIESRNTVSPALKLQLPSFHRISSHVP